jgi:hypothetical protein
LLKERLFSEYIIMDNIVDQLYKNAILIP